MVECVCVFAWAVSFDFVIHLFDQLPQEWQTHKKKRSINCYPIHSTSSSSPAPLSLHVLIECAEALRCCVQCIRQQWMLSVNVQRERERLKCVIKSQRFWLHLQQTLCAALKLLKEIMCAQTVHLHMSYLKAIWFVCTANYEQSGQKKRNATHSTCVRSSVCLLLIHTMWYATC